MRGRLQRLLGRNGKTGLLIVSGLITAGLIGGGAYAALGGSVRQSTSADIELQRGLIGHWKLDGSGKDATPYGRDMTVEGTTNAADRKGKSTAAKSLNGTSDYMYAANFDNKVLTSGGYSSSWTLSIWAKQNGPNVAENIIFGKTGCNGGLQTNGSTSYRFTIWNATCNSTATVIAIPSNASQWHLLTGTYSNGLMTLYLDGQSVGSTTTASMESYDNFLRIGSSSGNWYFNGSVDDARVYNRAISAAEAKALYESYDTQINAASGQGGLIGHWKMDGNAKDATPNGNNGTVSGATLTTDRKGASSRAYGFIGSGANSINLGNSTKFNSPELTMSAWINLTTIGSARTIMAKEFQYKFRVNSGGAVDVLIGSSGAGWTFNNSLSPGGSITVGTWHHIAITISTSSNVVRVYINGVESGNGGLGSPITAYNTNSLCVASYDCSGAEPLAGSVDDARFYNRALSTAEIKRQYESYDSQINLNSTPTNTATSGNINQGLVGYWPFSGNAKDATPYANNGTVSGATLAPDRFGRANSAYNFNGTTSYMAIPDSDVLSPASITVNAWVYWTGGGTSKNIVSKNGNSEYRYRIDSAGTITVFDRGATNALTTSATLTPNQWYMVSFTGDASGLKIYINGALSASNAVAYGPSNTSGSLFFGTFLGTNEFFAGNIDEIRIYNRALGVGEIQALYASPN